MEEEKQIDVVPGIEGDELSQVSEDQLLVNLQNDVEAYTKALETAKKEKDNYNEQLAIDHELWDILLAKNALRKLDPQHEYEKNDRYWELQEAKFGYKVRMDKAMAEGRSKEFDIRIGQTEEALERAKEKLERFSGGE